MWFFLKRKNKQKPASDIRTANQIVNHADLIAGMGDFSDLEQDDVALKFWLPVAVEGAIEDLARYYQLSVSMMVRRLLAGYVYGRYAIAYMHENQVGIARRKPEIMFSRGNYLDDPEPTKIIYKVPELGKNIAAIKVWIPQRLHNDLGVLADAAGVLLSRFVREVLIGEVLGRGTLPERSSMLSVESTTVADTWERGGSVSLRQATELRELEDYQEEIVPSALRSE